MATSGDLTCDTGTGTTNSPVVSSASYNFVSNDVGKWLFVIGTDWNNGWYLIASVASNKATLNATVGQAVWLDDSLILIKGPSTAAGVAVVGTPTGGEWSVDYSQATAATFTATDLASTTGTTNPSTVTSATNPFTKAMIGNLIHVNSGTNFTAGWYEIVNVSGTTATLDRAVGTSATLTGGTYHIGGAFSLGSSDNTIFALGSGSSSGSPQFFIKGNTTFTTSGAISVVSGNAAYPTRVSGYASIRGDAPIGSSRPILNVGASSFTLGNLIDVSYLSLIGTVSGVLVAGTSAIVQGCKIICTSTTAARNGVTGSASSIQWVNCEFISYRGRAIQAGGVSQIDGCYFHSSDIGVFSTGGVARTNLSIFESCITAAWSSTDVSAQSGITSCTFYGTEAKMGIGVNLGTGSVLVRMLDNIVYGFVTGVSHADINQAGLDNWNTYFNNTANVNAAANWQLGPNTIFVNPSFTSVSQVTGTAGAFAAGNSILIDTTKNFTSLGVVAGQDYVYISAGTGVTNSGMYVGITSISTTTNPNDTLNLDTAQGTSATADKVYTITIGHNYLPTGSI